MSGDPAESECHQLLAEQQRYYRARAPSYQEGALSEASAAMLEAELASASDRHLRGDVLELACGPGTWTGMLTRSAASVTALDGAPEMLSIARAARPEDNVRFVEADIFDWRPDRRYDGVFFGFWLSHVPAARFAAFWAKLADCLTPAGWVVFVDDAYRSADELVYGDDASVIQRTLADGSRHRIVKMTHTAAGLQRQLAGLGWHFQMRELAPFFWGVGRLAQPEAGRGGRD